MAAASGTTLLFYSSDLAAVEGPVSLLREAGHLVHLHSTDNAALPPADLIVIDGRPTEVPLLCRRLRARLTTPIPILTLLDDPAPAARLACLEAGANAYLLRPFAPRELLLQVETLLRPHQLDVRLQERSAELHLAHQRLHRAYRQVDQELGAARRIQRAVLPRDLPDVPPLRLAVCHRPGSRPGGDSYDAFRLDEDHVGFYLADTMAHGVTAGLLTLFLKQAVRPKDTASESYRLVPPEEVLRRVNGALLDQQLPETPFLGMIYGLVNVRDHTVRFARAGQPAPVYLPHDGAAQRWTVAGSLLGVFVTDFAAQTHRLHSGDKIIFSSDGLRPAADSAPDRLLASADEHRALPVAELVERMANDLAGAAESAEDVTLLGLELVG